MVADTDGDRATTGRDTNADEHAIINVEEHTTGGHPLALTPTGSRLQGVTEAYKRASNPAKGLSAGACVRKPCPNARIG